jgi:hypothetical protein
MIGSTIGFFFIADFTIVQSTQPQALLGWFFHLSDALGSREGSKNEMK